MLRASPASGSTCLAAIVAALLGWVGCQPPPEAGPDAGVPPGGPEPVAVSPPLGTEDVLRDVVIRTTFSDHLDSASLSQSRIDLNSGPLSHWLRFYYDPVRRQLVTWPSSTMRRRVDWVLELEEGVKGLDGAEVAPGVLARFRTGDDTGDDHPYDPRSFEEEILPIFKARCAVCHGGDETTALAGLRLDSAEAVSETAIGVKADGWPSWDRIASDDPGGSYLLYKIIGEERAAGERMPRAAGLDGAGPPMPTEEREALSDWIADGASFFLTEG